MSAPQILKHMAEKDIPVFCTYLLSPEGLEYHAWEFDILVGDPEDPGAFFPPAQRRQALYLNALKIDAIGWYFNTPTIIECKPVGNLAAIGQVVTYQAWYRAIFGLQPRMMIVCEQMSRQVSIMCSWSDITVRTVPPATETLVNHAINVVRPLIDHRSILPALSAVS